MADVSAEELAELNALDAQINALLPPQYQSCYEGVSPESMGSAGLSFDADGKVAWDSIWSHFCDLALAGGPPHRGKLLEPPSPEALLAHPEQYQSVVEEIARGIWLTTRLPVLPNVAPGWVALVCVSEIMATWLVRAIVAENVLARQEQRAVWLPAGPAFRLAKEIKNVVTTVAKTCHYWTGHMSASEQAAAAFQGRADYRSLLKPERADEVGTALDEYAAVRHTIEQGVQQATGLAVVPSDCLGWLGIECATVERAVWLMRAILVENILVRREEAVIYVPVNRAFAQGNGIPQLIEAVSRAWRLWQVRAKMK